jgi:hypothetical protein
MTYCSLSDVYPLIPTLGTLRDAATGPPVVTATVPTATQGAALVAIVEAETIGVLAAAGVDLPVTAVEALAYLKSAIAYGAAAALLKSRFPGDTGPGSDSAAAGFFEAKYQAALKLIDAGVLSATAASEASDFGEGFTTQLDASGDETDAAAMFWRGMEF